MLSDEEESASGFESGEDDDEAVEEAAPEELVPEDVAPEVD